jgi:prepilin-type N-terminal cleavage/methylation domain-containing protein
MLTKKLRNQKGFTLIEIIAVLVILGILAAVAIPKFIDLQEESRTRAVQGAIAAGASQLTMAYAQALLNGTASASSWTYSTTTAPLGDFNATLTGTCAADSRVTITAGPTWLTSVSSTSKTKTYKICN